MDELYDSIKVIVGSGEIDASNIIEICTALVKSVEEYKHMNGKEKKTMVLDTTRKFVTDTKSGSNDGKELLNIIESVLPSVIDTFVSLDKKEIRIKTKKCFKRFTRLKCFKSCCK